jgi:hypothetical protein
MSIVVLIARVMADAHRQQNKKQMKKNSGRAHASGMSARWAHSCSQYLVPGNVSFCFLARLEARVPEPAGVYVQYVRI